MSKKKTQAHLSDKKSKDEKKPDLYAGDMPDFNSENKKVLIALMIAMFIVIGAIVASCSIIVNTLDDDTDEKTPAKKSSITATTAAPATSKPNKTSEPAIKSNEGETNEETTLEAVETTKPVDTKIPEELSQILTNNGIDSSSLDFNQLIVVNAGESSSAKVSYYEKNDNSWTEPESMPSVYGFVGIEGVGKASESATITPKGLFGISTAFGFDESIDTGLNYFQITEGTYWVDDPNSKYYNMHVEGIDDKDWNSAEHMIEYPSNYNYGFAFDYNTNPIVKGEGSAFFMHVSDHPTQGCVAVSEDAMKSTLKWLSKDNDPHILIV